MKTKNFMLVAILLLSTITAMADPPEQGKTIFMSRCAACHNVNQVLTGPALAGISERRPLDWIIKFVQSSQSMIKGGDGYAVSLYEKFKRVPMPDHADLTAEHIKDIVAYIKAETKTASSEKVNAPARKDNGLRPLSLKKDYVFFIVYLAIVAMLVGALWLAVRIKDMQVEKRQLS